MKTIVIFVIAIIAAAGSAWHVKGMLDEKEFEQRLLKAVSKKDTTIQIKYLPRKKESLQIKNPQKITKEHFKAADSIFQIAIKKGYDSASYLFAQKTVPVDTTIVFPTQDTLHYSYMPLIGLEIIDFKPFPSKQIETTITDTIFVPMPAHCETPWYNRWYVRYVELGIALYFSYQTIK